MAQASLNGSGSFDPDNDPLAYNWMGIFGAVSGVNPTVELGLGGPHEITLYVSDGQESDVDTLLITVEDNMPPTVEANLDHGDETDDDEGSYVVNWLLIGICA